MNRSTVLLWSIAIVLLAFACAAPSVTIPVKRPAEFPRAAAHRKIAVVPFDGYWSAWSGKEFSARLEGALGSIKGPDDQHYFQTISRNQLDQVVAELKLGHSGLVDPRSRASIGRLTGAEIIYTGSVARGTESQSQYSKNKPGCYGNACPQMTCYVRQATFNANVKAVEVKTGDNIYANSVSGTSSSDSCKDRVLVDYEELRRKAFEDAIRIVTWDVAPHVEMVKLELLEMTEGITTAQGKEALNKGLSLMKRGYWDVACEEFTPAADKEEKSAALIFNTGFCLELNGAYTEAQEKYRKASDLVARNYTGSSGIGKSLAGFAELDAPADPDQIVKDALARIEDQIRKQKELGRQVAPRRSKANR